MNELASFIHNPKTIVNGVYFEMASSMASLCPRCMKYPRPPSQFVHLPPDFHVSHANLSPHIHRVCQDCYLALLYTEEERKSMSSTDARVEPNFHLSRAYGVPFKGRDGIMTVRIRGAQPSQPFVVLYDHPDLVKAQIAERERQCAQCLKWDQPALDVEPGTYPAGRQWCYFCRLKLREMRERNRYGG
jgi:hypothetical protein